MCAIFKRGKIKEEKKEIKYSEKKKDFTKKWWSHGLTLLNFAGGPMVPLLGQGAHMFFWKEKQNWSIVFFTKNFFFEFPVFKLVSMMIMKIKQVNWLEISCENVINKSIY